MSATNRTLLVLDIVKGIIAVFFGNIGLPPLVRYLIGMIQASGTVQIQTNTLMISLVCLLITALAYHKTENKIIKALVIICLFIPVLLIFFSYFSVMKVPMPF
ncbi:MAG: hypothetical protein LUQ50_12860 [Methanospirillum sp.]|uniref:hypothetical protein n=1 Tax=Methanospirillum sp. TaxID=45200 RepID=UPI00237259C6|nr:hypothetical protein [Methanospirillum sp.]MDD1729945.1 hypothetical protein [Methanospirillum sp.]